jgi:hypothetical protein
MSIDRSENPSLARISTVLSLFNDYDTIKFYNMSVNLYFAGELIIN